MENYKTNILLTFFYMDDLNNPKPVRVTLTNVRSSLTESEITQIGDAFRNLIEYNLGEIELIRYYQIL